MSGDFSHIPIIDVAHKLLGQEGPRSTSREKHFAGHGGLFINPEKGVWRSHGDDIGGDVVKLVMHTKGCDFLGAVSWLEAEGYERRPSNGSGGSHSHTPRKLVITYDYRREDGEAVYHVDRFDNKTFSQWRTIDGERVNGIVADTYERSQSGVWFRLKGRDTRAGPITRVFPSVEPLPYRLPEYLKSDLRASVLIPGGEKDADSLCLLGFTATTNHGGEGKWSPDLSRWFEGRRVYILCDNDSQGEKHQEVVGTALSGVAGEIYVVRFPELPSGGDVSDWIESRKAARVSPERIAVELKQSCREAPAWQRSASNFENWPEPVPLPEGLSRVDSFEPELLPEAIAPWVMDIADRMQCPPDYIAVSALVGLGAVLGRKVGIRPQRQTDWFEVPNLWGCIVGRPGSMKSPAINEALKPLYRLETKAREAHDLDAADHEKQKQIWKLRKDAAEARARADLKKNAGATVVFDLPEPEEPAERRYIPNDTTYEKLGEIHAANPNGILAHRDELVSLLKTLDREEYAAARGFYLTGWNGTTPYKFDRIMRGKTHIDAVCLSVLGSTQPGRLAEYVRRAVSGGAGDDGLIQRFGLLVWPDELPSWRDVDRYPDSPARASAWRVFEDFECLDPGHVGAKTDTFNPLPCLGLDAEAHGIFLEWRQDLESRLRNGELPPALESHLAKYRKLVPGLALINHLADGGRGDVGEQAMLKAMAMSLYLESHAKRAYASGPEAETAAAKAILEHVRKRTLPDEFSARDIHQKRWARLTDRNHINAGLVLLCEHNWIAAREKLHPGAGRPTTLYTINPRAMQ